MAAIETMAAPVQYGWTAHVPLPIAALWLRGGPLADLAYSRGVLTNNPPRRKA